MHLLNPILSRQDTHRWVDNPSGSGQYLDTFKYFVSCSCGWQEWWESRSTGEDRWIEHMVNVSYAHAHSEPFNTGVDGE